MPIINVQIEWDDPDDPNWLNPFNIELVLAEYCPNTAFSVKAINDAAPELLEVCQEILAYREGRGRYDFRYQPIEARENAMFDAWQNIEIALRRAIAKALGEEETTCSSS